MNLLKMRRKILVISLILTAIIAISVKNKRRYAPVPQKGAVEKMGEKLQDGKVLLARAEGYFQKGELAKAKKTYQKIVKRYPDSEVGKKAEERLGETNIKLLFSPFNMENSEIYKVKPGDNLFTIAKKFGTTVDLIKKSNNLESSAIYPEQRLKIPRAKFSILIDRSDNTLTLEADDKFLKKYLISTGKNNSTPLGEFKIVSKLMDPVWYFQGKAISPQSPSNILGSRWLGLSVEGYGIHGTSDPETLGKQITRGCIRMLNEDVEELYSIVPIGTKVIIQD